MTIINLLYNHWTPYGALKNGLDTSNLNEVFKESLHTFNEVHYTGELKEYFLSKKTRFDLNVNIIKHDDIQQTKYTQHKFVNLFIIEDVEKSLYTSDELIEEFKSSDFYYFVIFNKDGNQMTQEFIDSVVKFKKDFLINKTRILYMSPIKPDNNIYWTYFNFKLEDLNSDNLLDNFLQDILKIEKKRFI